MKYDQNLKLDINPQTGLTTISKNAIKLRLLKSSQFAKWLSECSKSLKNWIISNNFKTKPGSLLTIPDKDMRIIEVIAIIGDKNNFWDFSRINKKLSSGNYQIEFVYNDKNESKNNLAIAWALENYLFSPFNAGLNKPEKKAGLAKLVLKRSEIKSIAPILNGIFLTRDLINSPANIVKPSILEEVCKKLAKLHNAKFKVIKDNDLEINFPLIHTVGRAAEDKPRLIEISHIKNKSFPNITVIGKGVTFDSGGLDLKPPKAMELMKKDMGGAAIAIGLTHSLFMENLDLNLRLLVPAVENAVSSKSMRPQDIIHSRSGIDVEIGNTDAEGRLILADTLFYADEKPTDLIIDFATLTGAARVALGTELPALFSNDNDASADIITSAEEVGDPLFRLPLYKPYERFLENKNGSISSIGSSPYGGAITAALFLQKFIKQNTSWMHLDIMAWNLSYQPGRPIGGEAMTLRAFHHYLKKFIRKN